jgi:pantetheine-phosphate adenylyltransferase
MKSVIYPGSFDPITNGHLDIIERVSLLFDKVYVCVAENINKKTYFTIEERLEMVKEACKNYKNIEVISTSSLIVKKARELKCDAIVRGLRAVTDFEYEFQLAAGNEYLDKGIETIFLMASTGKGFISSSSIKEFHKHNVNLGGLVPEIVIEMFKRKDK